MLSNERRAWQTFRVAERGALTAIEVVLARCGGKAEDEIAIAVFEGQGPGAFELGRAKLGRTLRQDCTVVYPRLHPTQKGAATFDLSSACIELSPDREYSFSLEVLSGDPTTFRQGKTHVYPGTDVDLYPRGSEGSVIQGHYYRGDDNDGSDASFKIYMQR